MLVDVSRTTRALAAWLAFATGVALPA